MKFNDPLYKILQNRKLQDLSSIDKLLIIARVMQGDWVAKYANPNTKWYCWFIWDNEKAAFVFSNSNYDYVFSCTFVGSRLCLPDSKTAEYFGTQFIKEQNDYLITIQ